MNDVFSWPRLLEKRMMRNQFLAKRRYMERTETQLFAYCLITEQMWIKDNDGETPLMCLLHCRCHPDAVYWYELLRHWQKGYTTFGRFVEEWYCSVDSDQWERTLAALLTTGALLEGTIEDCQTDNTALIFCRSYGAVRYLLAAGFVPTKADVEHSRRVFSFRYCCCRWQPSIHIPSNGCAMMKLEEAIKLKETNWKKKGVLFVRCAKRLLGLSLIFIRLPTLIIVEICWFVRTNKSTCGRSTSDLAIDNVLFRRGNNLFLWKYQYYTQNRRQQLTKNVTRTPCQRASRRNRKKYVSKKLHCTLTIKF